MAISSLESSDSFVEYLVVCITAIGQAANLISIVYKCTREFDIPKLWKLALLTIDFAYLFLGVGHILFYIYLKTELDGLCKAAGFFVQFGIFDVVCGYLTAGIILLGIYNPGKSTKLSAFHKGVFLVLIIPQKVIALILSILPTVPIAYFTDSVTQAVACYKISRSGESADKFGYLIWFIIWVSVLVAILTVIIGLLKHCKGLNNRIHAASPNVWQTQVVSQGKVIQRFLLVEDVVLIAVILLCCGAVYTGSTDDGTWIFYISLAASSLFHGLVGTVQGIMWTSCCCKKSTAVDNTHRKLKRLDLVKIDVSIAGVSSFLLEGIVIIVLLKAINQ